MWKYVTKLIFSSIRLFGGILTFELNFGQFYDIWQHVWRHKENLTLQNVKNTYDKRRRFGWVRCGERWNLYDCEKHSSYTYALSDFRFPIYFTFWLLVDFVLFLLFILCSVYLFVVFCHSDFCLVLFCLLLFCSVLLVLLLSCCPTYISLFCCVLVCFALFLVFICPVSVFCFRSNPPSQTFLHIAPKLFPDMLFDTELHCQP